MIGPKLVATNSPESSFLPAIFTHILVRMIIPISRVIGSTMASIHWRSSGNAKNTQENNQYSRLITRMNSWATRRYFDLCRKDGSFLQEKGNLNQIATIIAATPAQAFMAPTRGIGYGKPRRGTQRMKSRHQKDIIPTDPDR